MSVRAVRPGDGPALRRVRLAALADSPLAFATTFEAAAALPPEAWEERVARSLGDGPGILVVAEAPALGPGCHGLMGGFVAVDGRATLYTVWVDPRLRGGPAAGLLHAAVCAWARSAGHDALWLLVWSGNARARAFYARLGWAKTGLVVPHELDHSETEHELRLDLTGGGRVPAADGPATQKM